MTEEENCVRKLVLTVFTFIFAAMALFQPAAAQPNNNGLTLTDIDNHWAKEAILKMAQEGIAKGYQDNTFRPDHTVTYAEAATFLKRLLAYKVGDLPQQGIPEKIALKVTDGHWGHSNTLALFQYYAYLLNNAGADVMETFHTIGFQLFPDPQADWRLDEEQYKRPMSRQDIAVLLWPLFHAELVRDTDQDIEAYQTKLEQIKAIQQVLFTDMADRRESLYPYVASHFQVITGYQDDTFRPDRAVTRAEMMVILQRVADFVDTYQQASGEVAELDESYYPFTEGRSWSYLVRNRDKIMMVMTNSTSLSDDDSPALITTDQMKEPIFKENFIKNNSGISLESTEYITRDMNVSMSETPSEPLYLFKFGAKTGDIWETDGEYLIDRKSVQDRYLYQWINWYEKEEAVQVPVGKFNTIKVTSVLSLTDTEGNPVKTDVHEVWLAKGTGMVKKITTTIDGSERLQYTYELISDARIPQEDNKAYNMFDYYPMDKGSWWDYKKTLGTDQPSSHIRFEINQVNGQDINFNYTMDNSTGITPMTKKRDGIYYSSNKTENYQQTMEPDLKLFPDSFTAGETLTSETTYIYSKDGISAQYKYTLNTYFEGIETVNVPAGTFETLKITTISILYDETDTPVRIQLKTRWMAEGVGTVKQLISEAYDVAIYELTDYHIED
ncbi:MAG: S-layer homology domain-containing protein [Bacillaceae bacterium]|nr:S-layer homology domain-containing protein [Bacillaceae bacterium]